jgi:hypothetical protein
MSQLCLFASAPNASLHGKYFTLYDHINEVIDVLTCRVVNKIFCKIISIFFFFFYLLALPIKNIQPRLAIRLLKAEMQIIAFLRNVIRFSTQHFNDAVKPIGKKKKKKKKKKLIYYF